MPFELISLLEREALVDDWEVGHRFIEGMQLLIEEWREFYDTGEQSAWQKWETESDLVVSTSENGALEFSLKGSVNPYTVIPGRVISGLYRIVLDNDEDERIRGIEGVADLVGEWGHLVIDEEKLAGHILRVHDGGDNLKTEGHEHMVQQHVRLHREAARNQDGIN